MTEVRETETAQKDRSEKYLESFNDVFADIGNNLVFGAPLIKPEALTPGPTETVYKVDGNVTFKEQRRDCSKYLNDLGMVVSIIGMENQTTIDSDMGIRVMGYDYGSYRYQISTGANRYGVITIVLYFGKKPWNRGMTLKSPLAIPEELEPYVSDYHYHLIDVPRLSKEKRDRLTSDFKVVADFFAEKNNKDYQPSRQEIVHAEAVLHMLKTFTGDDRYEKIEADIMENVKKGVPVTMCEFAERMERQGIEKGRTDGIIALISTCNELGLSKEDTLHKLCEKLNLEETEAQKYIEENWK